MAEWAAYRLRPMYRLLSTISAKNGASPASIIREVQCVCSCPQGAGRTLKPPTVCNTCGVNDSRTPLTSVVAVTAWPRHFADFSPHVSDPRPKPRKNGESESRDGRTRRPHASRGKKAMSSSAMNPMSTAISAKTRRHVFFAREIPPLTGRRTTRMDRESVDKSSKWAGSVEPSSTTNNGPSKPECCNEARAAGRRLPTPRRRSFGT